MLDEICAPVLRCDAGASEGNIPKGNRSTTGQCFLLRNFLSLDGFTLRPISFPVSPQFVCTVQCIHRIGPALSCSPSSFAVQHMVDNYASGRSLPAQSLVVLLRV